MPADEPTANLDSASSHRVLTFLQQLTRDRGHALLTITHDPAVRAFADCVLVMRHGCLVS